MIKKLLFASLLNLACLASTASAHYLWVAVTVDSEGKATANIYFEESPGAGTGEYLDPILRTNKTWLRTVEKPQPQALEVQDKKEANKRWLTADLPQSAPRGIDSYGKYGVYRYGQTDVLLHYYARCLDLESHEELHELARAEQMRLDIVPHDEADGVQLKVLWEGKPAGGRPVSVRGPKGLNQNLKTDDQGLLHVKTEAAGQYTFRAYVEEDKSGRDNDKEYSLIRHHATLVIKLPLKK